MPAAVDVIVVARNNRDIIGHTLRSLERQTLRPASCVLIDGRSTDGTVETVREEFPWVEVVVKESDSGPADSRNRGFRMGSSGYALFLDSDVTLDDRWLERQVEFLEANPDAALVCGKLLDAADPSRIDAAFCAMNRYGVAWDGGFGQPASSFPHPLRCVSCTSAALLARRAAIDEIGGFDDAMFAIHEDSDLGWRANILGYSVFFNPQATALHRRHSSLGRKNLGDRIIYLLWRNRLRSALVNYELSSMLRYGGVFLALSVLDALARGPRRVKFEALAWNLRHLRDTWQRRKAVQQRRRVKDRDLWFLFADGVRGPAQY
jgi:hypothetical protein